MQNSDRPPASYPPLPWALYFRLVLRLALEGGRSRWHRLRGRSRGPRALTLTVTRRCDSRCLMCRIWQLQAPEEELSLADLRRFCRSPALRGLVELDLTGGEPFLRRDLPELVEQLLELAPTYFPRLRTIALATNALRPEQIHRLVGELLARIAGRVELALVCSLDALGELHDRIRGVPGAYQRVRQTLDRLATYRTGSWPFQLGLKTTILPLNWAELPRLQRFAREQHLFQILSPVLFTQERFRNLPLQPQLDLWPRYQQELSRLYAQATDQLYYAWTVLATLRRGHRPRSCTAGLDHFFVEGDGTIYPCPLRPEPLGRLQTNTLEEILTSPRRAAAARRTGRHPTCRLCLEPGALRFSQVSDGWHFLAFLLGPGGRQRAAQAYWGEGLEKYFI